MANLRSPREGVLQDPSEPVHNLLIHPKRLLEQVPPGTLIPVEVWIGEDDDLPYKFQMAYDVTEGGATTSMTMTMTMTDWGSDISVEAPPADEVFDATALAAQGSSGP